MTAKPSIWIERGYGYARALGPVVLCALWLSLLDLVIAAVKGALPAPRPGGLFAVFAGHTVAVTAVAVPVLVVRVAVTALAKGQSLGRRAVVSAAVLTLACAVPAFALGQNMASGAGIGRSGFAPMVHYGAAAGALGFVFILALHAFFARPRWHWLGLWLAVSFTSSLTNAYVFVGLYATAHLALYAVSLATGLVGAAQAVSLVSERKPRRALFVFAAALLGVGLLGAPLVSGRERGYVLKLSAPLTDLVGRFVPPAAERRLYGMLQELRELPVPAEPAVAERLAPPPTNVLLLVVDTLRADALPPVRTADVGYVAEADTPFLNAWLESTYRFKTAYSQGPQTKRSLPYTFRSIEAWESPGRVGIGLAERMRQRGLRPVAIVPEYFKMKEAGTGAMALLDGFERVQIYAQDEQAKFLAETKQLLGDVAGEPFFAWVHFFCMHAPYFDGKLQGGKQARAEQYQRGLRWVDGQLRQLVAFLEEKKLLETTLVVLMSDHGEHLGELGWRGHGDGLHEQEIRVPLAFRLPGAGAGQVDTLVGNIDVVPTIVDLLGAPARRADRGQSLVATMLRGGKKSERALYQGNHSELSMVTERYRLGYAKKHGVFRLYDRARDPFDREDLFGADPARDAELVNEFVGRNPEPFAGELKDPATRELLSKRLDSLEARAPSRALETLLQLARLSKEQSALSAAKRVFERSGAPEVRLTVLRELFRSDPKYWSEPLARWLRSVEGTPQELAVVRGLSEALQPSFELQYVAKRLSTLAAQGLTPLAEAWLTLTAPWGKPAGQFTEPLRVFLQRLPTEATPPSAALLRALLDNVATLQKVPRAKASELEPLVVPYLGHPDFVVAQAACRALGTVGGEKAFPELRSLARSNRNGRLRSEALRALASREGDAATPFLLEVSEDPALTSEVIRLLAGSTEEKARAFLRKTAQQHPRSMTRREAIVALKPQAK